MLKRAPAQARGRSGRDAVSNAAAWPKVHLVPSVGETVALEICRFVVQAFALARDGRGARHGGTLLRLSFQRVSKSRRMLNRSLQCAKAEMKSPKLEWPDTRARAQVFLRPLRGLSKYEYSVKAHNICGGMTNSFLFQILSKTRRVPPRAPRSSWTARNAAPTLSNPSGFYRGRALRTTTNERVALFF